MTEAETWAMQGQMDYAYDGDESGSIACKMTLEDGTLSLVEGGYVWIGRMTEPGQYELKLQEGDGSGVLHADAPDQFSGRFAADGFTGAWSIKLEADLEW